MVYQASKNVPSDSGKAISDNFERNAAAVTAKQRDANVIQNHQCDGKFSWGACGMQLKANPNQSESEHTRLPYAVILADIFRALCSLKIIWIPRSASGC
jgi:hypothetical protein